MRWVPVSPRLKWEAPAGSSHRALARLAEAYADQNELDYAALREAVDSGSVEAVTGV